MLLPAAYFALRYPLRGHTDRLYDIGKLADYQVAELIWFCLGLGAMFVCYALAALEARRVPVRRALPPVFVCGGLLTLLFAWMYPVNAIDLFIYAVRSRLWTEYGQNPNAAYPETYWESDDYMHFAMREWADDTSPYGPLWNLLAAPATLIGGDSISLALTCFKILAGVAVLLAAWLIVRTLGVLRPADAATGALIFLWNPLVLWEGVGNGHNDVVLVALLLASFYAWARRWDGLVVPLLVAAALLKFVTLLILPLVLVALWQRAGSWATRWRIGWQSAAGTLVILLIGFAPFYDVPAVTDSARRQSELISTSPAGMAIGLLRDHVAQPGLTDTVKTVSLGIVLIGLGWLLMDVWFRPARLPAAAFELVFLFLLVAAWNFRAWYLIWPVALVAVLPLGLPFWRVLAWTAGALLAYAHYIWVWHWWDADYNAARNVGVLIAFGPVLLLSLIGLIRGLRAGAPVSDPTGRSRANPAAADG
jgi:hypothetical protein